MSGLLASDQPVTSGTTARLPLSGEGSGGLGGAPPGPQSAAEKLINAEQQRSDRQRIDSIQRQLRLETASSGRGYGIRSLLGALGGTRSLLGSG